MRHLTLALLLASSPSFAAPEIVYVWEHQAAAQTGKFFRLDHLTAQTESDCTRNAEKVRKSTSTAFEAVMGQPFTPVLVCVKRPDRLR